MSYNDQMKVSPLLKYLSFQLYTAILLSPKISEKSDPEYLHKFRVAIRRSHSLITLYMPEQYAFLDLLKGIVQKSNELRELDVFSKERELLYYPHLQKALQQHRKTLFDETLTLKARLKTNRLLNCVYDDLHANTIGLDSEELISRAQTHYKQCMQSYRDIDKKTTEKQLHRLRLDFKIARYAFEFLTESALKDEKKKLDRCKQKQDQLGLSLIHISEPTRPR